MRMMIAFLFIRVAASMTIAASASWSCNPGNSATRSLAASRCEDSSEFEYHELGEASHHRNMHQNPVTKTTKELMKDVEIANQALLDRLSGMAQRASVPPYPHKKGAMDWSKPTDPSCFCGAAPTWYEEYTGADGDCTKYVGRRRAAGDSKCKSDGERRRRSERRRRTNAPGENCASCFEECGHYLVITDTFHNTGSCKSPAYMYEKDGWCKGFCYAKQTSEQTEDLYAGVDDGDGICTKTCTASHNTIIAGINPDDPSHVKCLFTKKVICGPCSASSEACTAECTTEKNATCLTVCEATSGNKGSARPGTCNHNLCNNTYCDLMMRYQ